MAKHDVPFNSITVVATTTLNAFCILMGDCDAKSHTVSIPSFCSLALVREPIPQTSPTGTMRINFSLRLRSDKSTTPFVFDHFLAAKLANFAKVFVGPIPTQTGIPVCLTTFFRIRCP